MDEIVEYTKRAYSPGMIHDLEEAEINGGHGLNWDDAGPMAHVVSMGSYAHDGCISTTWEMAERPKSAFTETVLRPLLDPARTSPASAWPCATARTRRPTRHESSRTTPDRHAPD
ncbi:hypothetical protein GS884_08550 [Rhodococcus hoagii]|nr:hypothetical protein [Prescottella equi]